MKIVRQKIICQECGKEFTFKIRSPHLYPTEVLAKAKKQTCPNCKKMAFIPRVPLT